MSKPVPRYIAKQYAGGARGFRRAKRAQLRQLARTLGVLRNGCAFFPSGPGNVEAIQRAVDGLKFDLSVRNWGR